MELARRAGLDVAAVELTQTLGRDALLVERFDRPGGGQPPADGLRPDDPRSVRDRRPLRELRRPRGRDPRPLHRARRTLRELFARIVFNVLTGNTDDHPRNHAAFWDGDALTLTPAYDVCPQPRAGGESAQIMAIGRDGFRMSQVAGCVERAATYLLSEREAREVVDHQLDVIATQWNDVCDAAALSTVDRASFWRRQFLNPYALEGYR